MNTTRNILPCPVCRSELQPSERQGIEIGSCPTCRGVWLDRGELDKIIERSAEYRPRGEPEPFGRARPYGRDDDDDDDHHRRHGGKRRSFLSDLFD
ncbi:TFIIB-type zinc ribbon-containing protein [Sphingomonas alpina]|uniref:Zf-TFIIB domain-containing protein n=1 Tax=Sphingomonas alpina TaxID=653931 RepID=A0A7H0LM18_9SPHN|nr:zf-TFIIB domain-containing protein [Sphingomonas alpina]QNQ10721.1 zf-TFIIB domain-containing protein [Sphingomonas alpina]